MVKLLSVIQRVGNKETDIKYFCHLLPVDNIETIIEPFGGSFAVSRSFYKNDTYKYHINDTDPCLFFIYKNYKKYIEICTDLDIYYNTLEDQNERDNFKIYVKNLTIDKYFIEHLLINKFYRNILFKPTKNHIYNNYDIYILDNAILTNEDYTKIFEKYKDDEKAFVFIDPPYLFSDNTSYYSQQDGNDMTKIIIDILNFMKTCKCKVMLVINQLYLIKWIFNDFYKLEYQRTYQLSKNKNIHGVYCNY